MTIEKAAPRNLRGNYKPIVAAVLAAAGDWVGVPLDRLTGPDNSAKAAKLHAAAYQHGLRFQTTLAHGCVYVRLRAAEPAPVG